MNNYEEVDPYTDCVEYAEGLINKTRVEVEFVIQATSLLMAVYFIRNGKMEVSLIFEN